MRTRPFPEAGFSNLWELYVSQPEVGRRRERERRGGGWVGGGEKAAEGHDLTRLASGQCAPQAPGEPCAPQFGRLDSCQVSLLLVEELPGPAAESARSEPRTFCLFFFFTELDKVADS